MQTKRCGFYIRVSSEKQASVEEGSLRNQEQRLSDYAKMRSSDSDEKWIVVERYIETKSGKDTANRPEFCRMMVDIENGKIDTVLCTELSRISRSIRDLLDTVDLFNKYKVNFVCLKESFDTTTAQGQCFLGIMGVLNQFERVQVSQRTRVNLYARACRGLWHGGYLLGYNLDSNRKGHLIPDKREAQLVNFLFDTYLDCGSVLRTALIANTKGYIGKEWISKRGKAHKAKAFCYSAVLNILTNCAYIGEREVNKWNKSKEQASLPEDRRYLKCPAVWLPIIDRKKFDKVQLLLKENLMHKNNGAKPTKHSYLFNGNLLYCHRCGARMEGRNGHGHSGKVYYYYFCVNKKCRFRVREEELELSVQKMIQLIASRPAVLNKVSNQLNMKLKEQLPHFKERRRTLQCELNSLKNEAAQVMDNFMSVKNGKEFVEDRLASLDSRKSCLTRETESLDWEISNLEKKTIEDETVKKLLDSLGNIFKQELKPFQKRILLTRLLDYLRISSRELKLGIDYMRFRSDITQILRFDDVPHIALGSHLFSSPTHVSRATESEEFYP